MAASVNLSRRNWFAYPEIRALTPAERGVYLDLVVMANESPRRGYLDLSDVDLCAALQIPPELLSSTKDRLVELGLACRDDEGHFCFPEIVKKETARRKRAEAMAARRSSPQPADAANSQQNKEIFDRLSRVEEAVVKLSQVVERLTHQLGKLARRARKKRKASHSGNGHHSLLEEQNPSSPDAWDQVLKLKSQREQEELRRLSPQQDPMTQEQIERRRAEILKVLKEESGSDAQDSGDPPSSTQTPATEDLPTQEEDSSLPTPRYNIPSWLGNVDEEIYHALLQTKYADLLVEPESPPWPQPDKEPVRAYLKYRHRGPWTTDTYIAYSKLPEVAEALAAGDPIGFPSGAVITREMPCYRFPEQWSTADSVIAYRMKAWKDDLVIPFHPAVDPPRPDYDQRPIIDRRPLEERPYIMEVLKELRAKGMIRPLLKSTKRPSRRASGGVERLFKDIPPKSEKVKSTPIVEADPDDGSEEFLVFPTRGDSQYWRIRKDLVDKLQERYDDLDVRSELVKALTWVEAHPSRRKTARGMMKFLVGWLNRASQRVGTLARGERPRDYRIDGYPIIRHPDDIKYSIY